MADEGATEQNLHIIQSMIDVSAQRLVGLRTQCATSAELTQQEIRTLEGKLIKMFSNQLVTKAKLQLLRSSTGTGGSIEQIPSLAQWLQVVGLGNQSVQGVCQRISSVEELQEKSEHELRLILNERGARPEELNRLCRALHNLKKYTDVLRHGDSDSDIPLYWDSWDRHHQTPANSSNTSSSSSTAKGMSPRPGRSSRGSSTRASLPSEDAIIHAHYPPYHLPPPHMDHHNNAAVAAAMMSTSLSTLTTNTTAVVGGVGGLGEDSSIIIGGGVAPSISAFSICSVGMSVTSSPGGVGGGGSGGGGGGVTPTSLLPPSPLMAHPPPSPASQATTTPTVFYHPCNNNVISTATSQQHQQAAPNVVNCSTSGTRQKGMKFPTTPPALRKYQTGMSNSALLPDSYPLTKSKSHESQLATNKPENGDINSNCEQLSTSPLGTPSPPTLATQNNSVATNNATTTCSNNGGVTMSNNTVAGVVTGAGGGVMVTRRGRLQTEPGPDVMAGYDVTSLTSPVRSSPPSYGGNFATATTTDSDDNSCKSNSLQVPKSPRTIRHRIAHRFQKNFKMMTACGVCLKPIYFATGLKCKECKYRCHRECEDRATPSCGLTTELLEEVKKSWPIESQVFQSPNAGRAAINQSGGVTGAAKNMLNMIGNGSVRKYSNPQAGIHAPDSSSNTSSCNSSTPSSPALQSIQTPHGNHNKTTFHFPEINYGDSTQSLSTTITSSSSSTNNPSHFNGITLETHPLNNHNHNHNHNQHNPSFTATLSTNHHHHNHGVVHHHHGNHHHHGHSGVVTSTSNSVVTTSSGPLLLLPPGAMDNSTSNSNNTSFGGGVGGNSHNSSMTTGGGTSPTGVATSGNSGLTMDAIMILGGGGDSGSRVTTPVRVDSQDSQVSSDAEGVGVDANGHRWPRQNSLSNREWDIPFHELQCGEKIGTGRFGTVWSGSWHGDVAIKLLHVDYQDEAKILEQFRAEVGMFRKTRHENLVLFMGACMQPPQLAIVTSLCKGMTLYTHIHLRKDKFGMGKTTSIGQQISQGMGYLHAKGILHKDLKSKNIFLENGKVVITDFGLFSVTKFCFGNMRNDKLGIPPGWLCYLSPEIMRSLKVKQSHDEELPFTKASDVYAFGTVWYELLCGDWPFKGEPPESVIWQVGNGKKMSLTNLQSTKDVKDVLMACWTYNPRDREDFVKLLERLKKLPTKRLARSPSHPIHLSRSAESVF